MAKKRQPKVFIATPHADRKNYCLDQYVDVIKLISYKNKTVTVADNSSTKDNLKLLAKKGLKTLYVNPKNKTNIEYVCESHNYLREAFLKSDAQFFLSSGKRYSSTA